MLESAPLSDALSISIKRISRHQMRTAGHRCRTSASFRIGLPRERAQSSTRTLSTTTVYSERCLPSALSQKRLCEGVGMKNLESRSSPVVADDASEERKGLLWDEGEDRFDADQESIPQLPESSRRRRCCISTSLIVLILAAVLTPSLYFGLRPTRPVADFDNQKLRSNGTHFFKKTALIVSIDGLRYVS